MLRLRFCGDARRGLLSSGDAPKIRDSFMRVFFDKGEFSEAQRIALGFGVYSGPTARRRLDD
jgi:hypothetical protein